MGIGITGYNSTIAHEFGGLLPKRERIYQIGRGDLDDAQMQYARYLFCQGNLVGRSIEAMSQDEVNYTWRDNFVSIAQRCDRILAANSRARICIIGSESGYAGSYDMAYAGAKAALHLYIETKRLEHPGQQIVGIAPGIILDSGMTRRRVDLQAAMARVAARRRGEGLSPMDVAKLARFVLYEDSGALCNTVIRLHGGTW